MIEPKTDAMFALAVRRSDNSARSDLSANGKLLPLLRTECIPKKRSKLIKITKLSESSFQEFSKKE